MWPLALESSADPLSRKRGGRPRRKEAQRRVAAAGQDQRREVAGGTGFRARPLRADGDGGGAGPDGACGAGRRHAGHHRHGLLVLGPLRRAGARRARRGEPGGRTVRLQPQLPRRPARRGRIRGRFPGRADPDRRRARTGADDAAVRERRRPLARLRAAARLRSRIRPGGPRCRRRLPGARAGVHQHRPALRAEVRRQRGTGRSGSDQLHRQQRRGRRRTAAAGDRGDRERALARGRDPARGPRRPDRLHAHRAQQQRQPDHRRDARRLRAGRARVPRLRRSGRRRHRQHDRRAGDQSGQPRGVPGLGPDRSRIPGRMRGAGIGADRARRPRRRRAAAGSRLHARQLERRRPCRRRDAQLQVSRRRADPG